ncbi:hypothetical protein [Kitasatospora sp. GP82]|uniref:hypothetical protein n=1 Tax=Kitasatospora sp. GP82 TaxID=3035089 RepID=UPI002474841C|nr:hypothetical protein [Kitasatospora sp. GP82]MDH6130235.1 hypothetical protein [Kitasatospora sp. GP82]
MSFQSIGRTHGYKAGACGLSPLPANVAPVLEVSATPGREVWRRLGAWMRRIP